MLKYIQAKTLKIKYYTFISATFLYFIFALIIYNIQYFNILAFPYTVYHHAEVLITDNI